MTIDTNLLTGRAFADILPDSGKAKKKGEKYEAAFCAVLMFCQVPTTLWR